MHADLKQIWTEFHRDLEHFIQKRVKDYDTTQDILQEVFIKINTHLEGLKDPSKLGAWIYQITRNAIHDYFRKHKNSLAVDELELPFDEKMEKDLNGEFQACLRPFVDQLDERSREAILLVEWQGLNQKELANKLQISYSGAKSRLQRARERLKKLFTDCCHIQTDAYGNILQYENRNSCHDCCS